MVEGGGFRDKLQHSPTIGPVARPRQLFSSQTAASDNLVCIFAYVATYLFYNLLVADGQLSFKTRALPC